MAVVRVVFVEQRTIAHTDQQIARNQRENFIFPRGMENLAMAAIVSQKTKLGSTYSEQKRVKDLEPEAMNREQENDAQGHDPYGSDDLVCIVDGLFVQQAILLD